MMYPYFLTYRCTQIFKIDIENDSFPTDILRVCGIQLTKIIDYSITVLI